MQTKFRSGTIAGIRMGLGLWWKGPPEQGKTRHVYRNFSLSECLRFSRTGATRRLRASYVSVSDLVLHCLALAQPSANAGNITLEYRVEHNLPALLADKDALEVVLINILSNAIKFTGDDGAVALRAGLSATGDLFFAVSDTGIGMSQDDVQKALAPFATNTREMRQGDHIGIGLPAAAALIRAHDGDIGIESVSGLGSIVTVTLPVARLLSKAAA